MTRWLPIIWKILCSLIVIFIITTGALVLTDWFVDEGFDLCGIAVNLTLPILVYFLIRLLNKKYNQLNPSDYGFTGKRFFRTFMTGAAIAILIIGAVLSISALFGVAILFKSLQERAFIQLLHILSVNLMVGAWEEMYFRGFVFNTLKTKLPFTTSGLISAALFTGLHAGTYDMSETTGYWYLEVLLLAYVLLYLYVITRSIWTPVAFHFMWDLLWNLSDDTENKVGLFRVSNYAESAILLDTISIFVLVAALILLIAINRYKSKKIKKETLFTFP